MVRIIIALDPSDSPERRIGLESIMVLMMLVLILYLLHK